MSPEGRITPGCPGIYTAEQKAAWTRITHWIHANSDAKFALQIGHAGAKASTCIPWEGKGTDQPLESGNWPLMAASSYQYIDIASSPSFLNFPTTPYIARCKRPKFTWTGTLPSTIFTDGSLPGCFRIWTTA